MGVFKQIGKAVHNVTKHVTAPLGHAADQVAHAVGVNKTDFLPPGISSIAGGINSQRHGKGFMKGALASTGNQLKLAGMAAGAMAAAPAVGAVGSTVASHAMPVLSSLGGAIKSGMQTDAGKFDWGKLGKLGTAAMAFKGQRDQSRDAKNYINQEQQRRDQFTNLAMQDRAASQPFRDLALKKLSQIGQGSIFNAS